MHSNNLLFVHEIFQHSCQDKKLLQEMEPEILTQGKVATGILTKSSKSHIINCPYFLIKANLNRI